VHDGHVFLRKQLTLELCFIQNRGQKLNSSFAFLQIVATTGWVFQASCKAKGLTHHIVKRGAPPPRPEIVTEPSIIPGTYEAKQGVGEGEVGACMCEGGSELSEFFCCCRKR
jgi:hypothetical protein